MPDIPADEFVAGRPVYGALGAYCRGLKGCRCPYPNIAVVPYTSDNLNMILVNILRPTLAVPNPSGYPKYNLIEAMRPSIMI